MFGISGTELLVVMLIALLVLGPERLPQVARFLAKITRELRKASDEVRMYIDPDIDIYRGKRGDMTRRMEHEKKPETPPEGPAEEKTEELKKKSAIKASLADNNAATEDKSDDKENASPREESPGS